MGEIERDIRTVKERVRATYSTLPYEWLPIRLIAEMVFVAVFWLNCFPNAQGISPNLSPRTIVTGLHIDFNRHCRYQFGEYVQTHEEHDNSMLSRTIGALALRPTGNLQGSFYFLSLSTGRVLNRLSATPIPMPEHVIGQVHRMARRQAAHPGLVFTDRHDQPYPDDNIDVAPDLGPVPVDNLVVLDRFTVRPQILPVTVTKVITGQLPVNLVSHTSYIRVT